jgi:hypothetical protein
MMVMKMMMITMMMIIKQEKAKVSHGTKKNTRSFCSHFLHGEQEMFLSLPSPLFPLERQIFSLLKAYSFPNKLYCYFHRNKQTNKQKKIQSKKEINQKYLSKQHSYEIQKA